MADVLKELEEIVNTCFREDPIEKINMNLRGSVDEYNHWLARINREYDEKKAELQREFEQIRSLETQLFELEKGIKALQPKLQDFSSVESHNKLVEEHNSLSERYNRLVRVYEERKTVFNRGTEETNKEIETRRQKLDLIQKAGKEEIEHYLNWLKEQGPERVFLEINQLYFSRIQKSNQSEKNKRRFEHQIDKIRNLREIIGKHAKNNQELLENGALIVQVELCGVEKSYMAIETGASVVSLTPEMVKILQIEDHVGEEVDVILAGGIRIKAPQLLIPSISYDGHEAKFVKAVILKPTVTGIDGSLGISFLNRFDYKIEGKNPRTLILQQNIRRESNNKFEIFISYKTSDITFARKIYLFLSQSGHMPFFADVSLKGLTTTEFDKEIDKALESARHFVLVCSSPENVKSGWVEREWRLFDHLKMSGQKKGNIIPVICGTMTIESLPIALRRYQTLSMNDPGWESSLLNYCR